MCSTESKANKNVKMPTNAPRGTKDILPDQIHKWQYVEKVFNEICENYGFKEIRTPMFEHTELFARGVGDTTDIVEKQMYTFKGLGSRDVTLKPEGTSGVGRALIEHKLYAEVQPTKLCYNFPCFRYEKPQAGRLRQFHQLGAEIFGSHSMLSDAEIICLAHDFLETLGIKEPALKVNTIGCPKCRPKHREALKEFFAGKLDDLCDTCHGRYEKNPMRILDCKSEKCQELGHGAPVMLDYLCDECREDFEELKNNLNTMGIEFEVDTGIVRGLDYYTKTAFEFVSENIGAKATICGGGRYNHLINELGGPETPGVGFGLGIERLLLTMEACGAEFPHKESTDVFIAVMGKNAKNYGVSLLRAFRKAGLHAEIDLLERNFKGQFKYADRISAKYVVVIGENELNERKLTVKDMADSSQHIVEMDSILEEILSLCNKN